MNDEERFKEFYLFPLKKKKRQVTGELVGFQLCAQCCNLESNNIASNEINGQKNNIYAGHKFVKKHGHKILH